MPACGGVFVTAKIYILAYDISKLAYNISLPLDTHNRPVACLGSRKGKAKGGGWKSLVTHAQKIRRKKKKNIKPKGAWAPPPKYATTNDTHHSWRPTFDSDLWYWSSVTEVTRRTSPDRCDPKDAHCGRRD